MRSLSSQVRSTSRLLAAGEDGQALVEYALILVVVVAVCAALLPAIGAYPITVFTAFANDI